MLLTTILKVSNKICYLNGFFKSSQTFFEAKALQSLHDLQTDTGHVIAVL